MKMKRIIVSLLIALLMVGTLGGCGKDSSRADKKEIVLLDGEFAEIDILMQMAAILIEENTDLKVKWHDSMAAVPAGNAVESGEVDLYITYDGTVISTHLRRDPSECPEGKDFYEWAKELGSKERGFTMTKKFGFENTYAIALHREFAEKNNIKTNSDLKPFAKDLVFGAEHEFFDEEGTMRFGPFNERYGMKWKDSVSLDLGLKFAAMDSNNIDATMIYSTDGLVKKSDLVVLEDDLKFFPQYFASFFVRDTLFEEYKDAAPNLEEVLNRLEGLIDNNKMIDMNYQVDAEGKKPYDVAKEFLVKNGLSK